MNSKVVDNRNKVALWQGYTNLGLQQLIVWNVYSIIYALYMVPVYFSVDLINLPVICEAF